MDGGISGNTSQPIPKIGAGEILYRMTMKERRRGGKLSVGAFQLFPVDDYKLSLDWARLTTPESSLAIYGATINSRTGQYKNWKLWEIHAVEVSFLLELERVVSVEYNPMYYKPPVKGKQDNPAHSLVIFDKESPEYWTSKEPEVLVRIARHAQERQIQPDEEQTELMVKHYHQQQDKIEERAAE